MAVTDNLGKNKVNKHDNRDAERVGKDLEEFDAKYPWIAKLARAEHREILDLALRYRKDTEFFLGKGDLITAFGAINYGFGLLDAVEKMFDKKKEEKQ